MKDLMGLMKQAQAMQANMQKMQEEMAQAEVVGRSGAGLVEVTLNGRGDMMRLKIDPSLMVPAETEVLEDLVLAATRDAKGKVEAQMQEKMKDMMGGLPMPPGLNLF